jgi:hypothetical protein
MNLREMQQQKRTLPVDGLFEKFRPAGCVSSSWLASYPMFQDALQRGETCFRALPHYAKRPILKRAATNPDALASTTALLNEVRAAYVELSAACVVEALECYLSAGTHCDDLQNIRPTTLDTVAAQFPQTSVPLIARQPCLLSPGNGVFLEGWTRFFAYWARADKTIPVVAVDWPALYDRLARNLPEDKVARKLAR